MDTPANKIRVNEKKWNNLLEILTWLDDETESSEKRTKFVTQNKYSEKHTNFPYKDLLESVNIKELLNTGERDRILQYLAYYVSDRVYDGEMTDDPIYEPDYTYVPKEKYDEAIKYINNLINSSVEFQ